MSQARYRFGEAVAELQLEDPAAERYVELVYGACAAPDAPIDARFRIEDGGGGWRLRTTGAVGRLSHGSGLALLRGIGVQDDLEIDRDAGLIRREGDGATVMRWEGEDLWVSSEHAPSRVLIEAAVCRTLVGQPSLLLLHAGAVVIEGAALLLVAPSGGGKTTLTMALSDRGHGLLTDELALWDRRDGAIVPFPRTLFPRQPGVRDDSAPRLARSPNDWGPRPGRTGLGGALFLGEQGAEVAFRPFVPSLETLTELRPLTHSFLVASTWGMTEGAWLVRYASVAAGLAALPCAHLSLGSVEETADAIEAWARQVLKLDAR